MDMWASRRRSLPGGQRAERQNPRGVMAENKKRSDMPATGKSAGLKKKAADLLHEIMEALKALVPEPQLLPVPIPARAPQPNRRRRRR